MAIMVVAALLPECVHDSGQQIVDGVYRASSSRETLTVMGKSITLHLNATKGPQVGMLSGTYPYEVLTNHELHFSASSNDSFFVFTVLDYKWLWDGKDIIRRHGSTGDVETFSRQMTSGESE